MFVKLFKNLFLPILFIIFSCDDAGNTISNPPGEINELYQFNLTFLEDTDNSDTITLSWDENDDISTFNIEYDEETYATSEAGQYTILLEPGEFKDVIITEITADDVLSDTIKIFSSPMAPSTWVPNIEGQIKVANSETEIDFSNHIKWNASTETDITAFHLYKTPQGQVDIITYTEDINLNIWSQISSFNINSVSPFSDLGLAQGEDYCYISKSIDIKGNARFSQIICNIVLNTSMLDVTISSVSDDLENKIIIEWSEYTNSDFYQYTILRSEDGEMDEASRIVLAEIINATQIIFEDRNNIGFGKMWYYQIEVHNQYGRTSESNIKFGRSKP